MIIKFNPKNKAAISEKRLHLLRNLTAIFLHRVIIVHLLITGLFINLDAQEQDEHFNYKRYLTGAQQTLSVIVENINSTSGEVSVTGGDSRCPSTPFTWDWGDSTITVGFFPQQHTYSDLTKNYIVKVTAHYSVSDIDSVETPVRFVTPSISPISLPAEIAVSIPNSNITLIPSRMPEYGIPYGLTFFDDSFFNIIPRATAEYILTVAASIQMDLANDDVYLIYGTFNQVFLRDPPFGGMYTLWYADPVGVGVGDYGFQGTFQWSSFFHEMGHNFTLNFPAHYYFGGKIDGDANAIYSETMAQIFQHVTAYEIINSANAYGLGTDITADIKQSAISSIKIVREAYEDYHNSGMNFTSWNDPRTAGDETVKTFMTIAYKFCEHAESSELGYRIALKRMMQLLAGFNEDLREQYDQQNNTGSADTSRSTLMVTALSYAFSTDLRAEFEDLNFPLSDEIYNELMNLVTEINQSDDQLPFNFRLKQNYPNPFNPITIIEFSIPSDNTGWLSIFDLRGQLLESHQFKEGHHRFFWNGAKYASGIYFYKLSSDKYSEVKKMLMIW